MKKFKKSFLLAVTSSIIISSSAFASNVSFDDVRKNEWFHEPIVELVKRGGVAGYQDGTFKPNGTITRAEFLKMAYSSATEKEYKAEKGHHWASGVHKAAMEKGIIDNTFPATSDYLNKPITREEMTTIIVNISEIIKGEPKVDTSKTASKIADLGKVSPERKADVLQAYQKGLLAGKGNGFEPQGKTTRGEAAMVIMRILDNDFRVDPDKVVEAPAGKVVDLKDPNRELGFKAGDTVITKDGRKVVLKMGKSYLGEGQKVDLYGGVNSVGGEKIGVGSLNISIPTKEFMSPEVIAKYEKATGQPIQETLEGKYIRTTGGDYMMSHAVSIIKAAYSRDLPDIESVPEGTRSPDGYFVSDGNMWEIDF